MRRNQLAKQIEKRMERVKKTPLLVLCHGKKHPRTNSFENYELIYIDHDVSCQPDIIMDITMDIDLFIPWGPFEMIVFMHPPFDLFFDKTVRHVIKKLLVARGVIYFDSEKEHKVKLKYCKHCFRLHPKGKFSQEVKERLFPNFRIIHAKLT